VIAGLMARASASRWARVALRCAVIVAAVLLFLLSIRCAGERTGRLLDGKLLRIRDSRVSTLGQLQCRVSGTSRD
jgi:hypothetical protein